MSPSSMGGKSGRKPAARSSHVGTSNPSLCAGQSVHRNTCPGSSPDSHPNLQPAVIETRPPMLSGRLAVSFADALTIPIHVHDGAQTLGRTSLDQFWRISQNPGVQLVTQTPATDFGQTDFGQFYCFRMLTDLTKPTLANFSVLVLAKFCC